MLLYVLLEKQMTMKMTSRCHLFDVMIDWSQSTKNEKQCLFVSLFFLCFCELTFTVNLKNVNIHEDLNRPVFTPVTSVYFGNSTVCTFVFSRLHGNPARKKPTYIQHIKYITTTTTTQIHSVQYKKQLADSESKRTVERQAFSLIGVFTQIDLLRRCLSRGHRSELCL